MLRLEMSEKARKWMEEKHLEGTLLAEQVGTGWAARTVALVQGGRPVREDEHLCLEDGEVRLWVPRWMRFEEDRVRLEVRGFLWTARVEADSAILPHGCV